MCSSRPMKIGQSTQIQHDNSPNQNFFFACNGLYPPSHWRFQGQGEKEMVLAQQSIRRAPHCGFKADQSVVAAVQMAQCGSSRVANQAPALVRIGNIALGRPFGKTATCCESISTDAAAECRIICTSTRLSTLFWAIVQPHRNSGSISSAYWSFLASAALPFSLSRLESRANMSSPMNTETARYGM